MSNRARGDRADGDRVADQRLAVAQAGRDDLEAACGRRRFGTATWIAGSGKREICQYRPPLNPASAAPSPAAYTAASHSPSRERRGWPTA